MPIGVASISLTCSIPGASIAVTWTGSVSPRMEACKAGIRLSRIRVVLPDPDTPVTAVSRPFGIFTVSGFTVWIAPVVIVIVPSANIESAFAFCRTAIDRSPERNPPIFECGSAATAAIVPCAMTVPPFLPASGPISMSQSASFKICVS